MQVLCRKVVVLGGKSVFGLMGWRTSKPGQSIVRMLVGLLICFGLTHFFYPLESFQAICLPELLTSKQAPLQMNCWYNESSGC